MSFPSGPCHWKRILLVIPLQGRETISVAPLGEVEKTEAKRLLGSKKQKSAALGGRKTKTSAFLGSRNTKFGASGERKSGITKVPFGRTDLSIGGIGTTVHVLSH